MGYLEINLMIQVTYLYLDFHLFINYYFHYFSIMNLLSISFQFIIMTIHIFIIADLSLHCY